MNVEFNITQWNLQKRIRAFLALCAVLILGLSLSGMAAGYSIYTETVAFFQVTGQKKLLLAEFRGLAGFGGLIHNFKNFVLRDEEVYARAFQRDVRSVRASLEDYGETAGLSDRERRALHTLEQFVSEYESKLPIIRVERSRGASPRQIDTVVRISDTEYIAALAYLEEHLEKQWTVGTYALQSRIEIALVALSVITVTSLGLLFISLYY